VACIVVTLDRDLATGTGCLRRTMLIARVDRDHATVDSMPKNKTKKTIS